MLFHRRERAQGMVEYALIIILIALAVIFILTVFGTQISTTFSKIANHPVWDM